MNPAEVATSLMIERTLSESTAYRKIDDSLYTVKQGSTYVLINVVAWNKDAAVVRCVAQLVKGVQMDGDLAQQLLELNAHMRFGAFAYDPDGDLVLYQHSILGGATLDPEELLATVRDVALIADEYDDRIIAKYGGQTMKELLEEAAFERILEHDPDAFDFGGGDEGAKS
jgi:hypothetical protein